MQSTEKNQDGSFLLDCRLPELMEDKTAGTKHWRTRREEIIRLLSQQEYGFIPPHLPANVKTTEKKHYFAGKGILETPVFGFNNQGESFELKANLIYPDGGKQYPFFVFANFSKDVPDKYFPAEELIDRGFGVISFFYQDVSKDENSFGEGLERLFLKQRRGGDTFGKISLWAWAMSAMLDYIFDRKLVLNNRVGAIGHSRLGKTALWAAANDERFSFVFSNDSGCSGAALSRNKQGETVADITAVFPHWFCKNYLDYAGREDEIPFDQHFLLSLIAPRTLVVGAAKEDTWADTINQYLCCKAAMPAYALYGMGGGFDDDKPVTGKKYGANGIFFRERTGMHYLSRDDWHFYMDIMTDKI